jgi:hypothetical protein
MVRRRKKDVLSHLGPRERGEVLGLLLKHHPELRDEVNAIAEDLIRDISLEAVSKEVVDLVLGIGLDALNGRAEQQPWGYVEPGEAAWELLEEAIGDIQSDMKRRKQVGLEPAAEKICQGIVLGLHKVHNTNTDGALGWAPDFPAEAAARTVSALVELYPRNRRMAAGKRIFAGLEQSDVSQARRRCPYSQRAFRRAGVRAE